MLPLTAAVSCVSQPNEWKKAMMGMWSDLIYNVCLTFITFFGTMGERERVQERAKMEMVCACACVCVCSQMICS